MVHSVPGVSDGVLLMRPAQAQQECAIVFFLSSFILPAETRVTGTGVAFSAAHQNERPALADTGVVEVILLPTVSGPAVQQ